MRALVQRVTAGSVRIGGETRAAIGAGLVVFVGVRRGDTAGSAAALAARCAALRVFEDAAGKMNLSLAQGGGSVLIVSQFTLYADTQRGNRPGFSEAAPPEEADALYRLFVQEMEKVLGADRVRTGVFRAAMEVHIINDGPVTIMLESKDSTKEEAP